MTLNLAAIYENLGETLSNATIDHGDGYYDLLDEFGEVVAMDGDEVEIVTMTDNEITLRNTFDGLRFVLNGDEFDTGIEVA